MSSEQVEKVASSLTCEERGCMFCKIGVRVQDSPSEDAQETEVCACPVVCQKPVRLTTPSVKTLQDLKVLGEKFRGISNDILIIVNSSVEETTEGVSDDLKQLLKEEMCVEEVLGVLRDVLSDAMCDIIQTVHSLEC